MQEHPLIELYVTLSNEQQNALAEQTLSTINLDSVVARTLQAVGLSQEFMLTLMVTDDDGIREMNKQYREQDKPTDVLSFPLTVRPLVDAPADQLWPPQEDAEADAFVTPPGMVTNLGDIVMSWPTIMRQANDAGHAYQAELIYLLSHGVLHLVGFDDQTEAGYEAMVAIQQSILQAMGQKAYQA
ncbi:MAG: rRNA maturation RNase YbeY [Ktedonobacteraceae bacterium]